MVNGMAKPIQSSRLRKKAGPSRIISTGTTTVGKVSLSRSTHCSRRMATMQRVAVATITMKRVHIPIWRHQSAQGTNVLPT